MRNRQFVFTPKIEYDLVAGRSEANHSNLQFPVWCRILKIVRTPVVKQNLLRGTAHFAPPGRGEEVPPFTRLNFLSEKFGGQESGNAAPARRSLGAGGEPHR